MNPDFLIRGVLGSVLGGGRKRSGRALRYLHGGGSIWTRPTTLLTAAGVEDMDDRFFEDLARAGIIVPGPTSRATTESLAAARV